MSSPEIAALEQATNRQLPTHIHLHKRIPPGSGMGGASSDAAATLKAAATLHHVTADQYKIATTIGAPGASSDGETSLPTCGWTPKV